MDSLIYMLIFAVVIVAGIGLIGLLLPRERRLTIEKEFDAPVSVLWEIITDYKNQQSWRSDLESVEILSEESWIETPKKGPNIEFKVMEKTEEKFLKLELLMNGRAIGFWTGEFIALEGQKSKIIFNENVTADSPYIRIISRLFFSLEKGMDLYIEDLQGMLEKEKSIKNF